jgi:hypothetical protein
MTNSTHLEGHQIALINLVQRDEDLHQIKSEAERRAKDLEFAGFWAPVFELHPIILPGRWIAVIPDTSKARFTEAFHVPTSARVIAPNLLYLHCDRDIAADFVREEIALGFLPF